MTVDRAGSPPVAGEAWPRLGIVVLNWNDEPTTRRCLESLRGLPATTTVYLVDNGSVDGSMDRLEAAFAGQGVRCLRNGANLGFAGGCNPGIRRAIEDGCRYVLLLNNDCMVPDVTGLRAALALAERDPRCGIVGAKVLQWPDTRRIWSVGGTIGWAGETFVGYDQVDDGRYDGVTERSFLSGAFMLLRRELIEAIGLLPDVYFFGHEDREYCVRARRAGFRLLVQPATVIHHEAGKSRRASEPMYVYNDTLSRVLFKRRTLSRPAFLAWRLAYRCYLDALLPFRHRLAPDTFMPGIDPAALRAIMRAALRDARDTDRVTLDMLERFRARWRSMENRDV